MIFTGFSFDGQHSSDMGLQTELISYPLYCEPKTVYSDVQGIDGEKNLSALNPRGRTCHKSRIIEFLCHGRSYHDEEETNFVPDLEILLELLVKEGDRPLILDIDRGSVYMAHVANLFHVDIVTENSFSFPLVFKCLPYRYDKNISTYSGVDELHITNDGYYTDMVIEVSGTAPKGFTVSSLPGGKFLRVNAPLDNNTAIIDTASCDVTINGISRLASCEGEFFELPPSASRILVSGEGAELTFSVSYRQRNL